MKKVLFLIRDLGQGGAEKVLVNLVNNINREKFDITVIALFGGGVNEQFLSPNIRFKTIFSRSVPGNSKLMKLLSPKQLHRMCVKERYDIEIAYLEGPSTRVISGCEDEKTKLLAWVHSEQYSLKTFSESFRNVKEMQNAYNQFNRIICVSQAVERKISSILQYQKACTVLYNTVESGKILRESQKEIFELKLSTSIRLVAVGSLKEIKGYDRLLRIIKRLKLNLYDIHLYILGIGPLESFIKDYIIKNALTNNITLLGYQTNPYKYVANCDLLVCSSYAEGFSTAVTESLIIGTPVCTVDVSGMRELLGENNEYGLVTENTEEALYQGIKLLIDNQELLLSYKEKAAARGAFFDARRTVSAVEEMLINC